MHPILFSIGGLTIHTYGFLIAVGFLSAVFIIRRLSRKVGLPEDKMVDFAFWMLLWGMVGSRILFVITRWDEVYSQDFFAIFKLWEGGLVFYGGLIAGLVYAITFVRKNNISFWKAGDVMMPALTLAQMFGRFGCFAAGCCYGKPTESGWGVIFTQSDLVDPIFRGVHLHPTQLYDATGLLVLFLGQLWVFSRKKTDGQVFLTYLMAYPIMRSIVEIFRGDSIRGFVIDGILSTSQFISILVFLLAVYLLWMRTKGSENEAQHKLKKT